MSVTPNLRCDETRNPGTHTRVTALSLGSMYSGNADSLGHQLYPKQLGTEINYKKILIAGKGKGKYIFVAPGSAPQAVTPSHRKLSVRASVC